MSTVVGAIHRAAVRDRRDVRNGAGGRVEKSRRHSDTHDPIGAARLCAAPNPFSSQLLLYDLETQDAPAVGNSEPG
jgi:hypothetical protein